MNRCFHRVIVVVLVLMLCCFVTRESYALEEGAAAMRPVELGKEGSYEKVWNEENWNSNCYVRIRLGKDGYGRFAIQKPKDKNGRYGSYDVTVYDSIRKQIWRMDTSELTGDGTSSYIIKIGLKAGEYLVNLKPNFEVKSGEMKSKISYKSYATGYYEKESNDSRATATILKKDHYYKGTYGEEVYGSSYGYTDWFKVKLFANKKYEIKLCNRKTLCRAGTILKVYRGSSRLKKSSAMLEQKGYVFVTPKKTGYYYIALTSHGSQKPISYQIVVWNKTKK